MKSETIQEKLRILEQTNNIRILYAAESGSRAWGIESVDSDYDIRFVYVRPTLNYLGNHPAADTIELLDGDLDFEGWDLRKTFHLLEKGNVTQLEWLASPIVYRECVAELRDVAGAFMRWNHDISHYYGLTKRIYMDCLKDHDEWPLKKALYAVRSMMMTRRMGCLSLLGSAHKHELPPISFQSIMDIVFSSTETYQVVAELLDTSTSKIGDLTIREILSQWLGIKRSGGEVMTVPTNRRIEEQIEKDLLLAHSMAQSHVIAIKPSSLSRADHFIQRVILG